MYGSIREITEIGSKRSSKTMSLKHFKSDHSGVVTSGFKGYSIDDNVAKRPIQRRDVYKGSDKRHRISIERAQPRLDPSSIDITDGNLVAKSAPGSGRTSPTDLLTLSLAAPKSWTPTNMGNPPIEAKVVILGAQGE